MKAQMPMPPIEWSFDMESLKPAKFPPQQKVMRAQLNSPGGYSLNRAGTNAVAVQLKGKAIGSIKSPSEKDHIIGFTTIGQDRAVFACIFGLFMVDLKNGKTIRNFVGHSDQINSVAPSPDGRFFLTGSADQKICLWSPERNDPVLTFFFAGDDWVAWSPEGYYACSANGERLMGWQINNGLEQLGTYYEAVRFHQSLYRPDVIKHLVKTGELRQALAQADDKKKPPDPGQPGAPQQPSQPINVAQVLPPQVQIVSPVPTGGELRLTQPKLQVTAAAKSVGTHPVTAMRLIVDGRPYQGIGGLVKFANPVLGMRSATWNVDLPPGKHIVLVQAESTVSKAVSEPLLVLVEGTAKQQANMYVLAVGINEYPDAKNKLNFATKDATDLAEVFQTHAKGLYGTVDVNILTDHAATKNGIMKGLEWMHSKMKPQDVGIFFFGGHGTQDPWGGFHLVPVDFDGKLPRETGLSGETVKKSLANMQGKLVCIFDACHSGSAATMDDLVRDLVTEDYGIIVMCSSLGSEYSLESPEIQHGVFTLALIEGLKGHADFDNDKHVFVHEVNLFANVLVKKMTKGMQNPITICPPSIPSFALTKKQ
jgi:hypothetical protein